MKPGTTGAWAGRGGAETCGVGTAKVAGVALGKGGGSVPRHLMDLQRLVHASAVRGGLAVWAEEDEGECGSGRAGEQHDPLLLGEAAGACDGRDVALTLDGCRRRGRGNLLAHRAGSLTVR